MRPLDGSVLAPALDLAGRGLRWSMALVGYGGLLLRPELIEAALRAACFDSNVEGRLRLGQGLVLYGAAGAGQRLGAAGRPGCWQQR